jgi:hypothetical protein
MNETTAPDPGWYPSPNTDGMLRWWDGTRWTEYVEQVPGPGDLVIGPGIQLHGIRYVPPDKSVISLYPPISDPRYADSPLAAAMIEAVHVGVPPGGDVRMPSGYVAGLEAAHVLKERGGAAGALAAVAELALGNEVAPSSGVEWPASARTEPGRAMGRAKTLFVASLTIAVGVFGVACGYVLLRAGSPADADPGTAAVPYVILVVGAAALVSGARQLFAARDVRD